MKLIPNIEGFVFEDLVFMANHKRFLMAGMRKGCTLSGGLTHL